MIKYMGMEFENHAELKEWCKAGNIKHYRTLARIAAQDLTMEIIAKMADMREILCNQYGMTAAELEEIEIEEMTA